MILGFDIGNTNTLMGIYEGDGAVPAETFRFKTDRAVTADELYASVRGFLNLSGRQNSTPEGVIFSSVVREVNQAYKTMSSRRMDLEPIEVTDNSKLRIKINYDEKSTLGPDRITNAEAAFTEYGEGIVIDIGTALTICGVAADGSYMGGVIAPGPGTAAESLAAQTSLLPKITIERPEKVTALNTVNAIRSGIYYGWSAMINFIAEKIRYENSIKGKIILTGGFAEIFSKDVVHDRLDPLLTMKGLRYIYRNER